MPKSSCFPKFTWCKSHDLHHVTWTTIVESTLRWTQSPVGLQIQLNILLIIDKSCCNSKGTNMPLFSDGYVRFRRISILPLLFTSGLNVLLNAETTVNTIKHFLLGFLPVKNIVNMVDLSQTLAPQGKPLQCIKRWITSLMITGKNVRSWNSEVVFMVSQKINYAVRVQQEIQSHLVCQPSEKSTSCVWCKKAAMATATPGHPCIRQSLCT